MDTISRRVVRRPPDQHLASSKQIYIYIYITRRANLGKIIGVAAPSPLDVLEAAVRKLRPKNLLHSLHRCRHSDDRGIALLHTYQR